MIVCAYLRTKDLALAGHLSIQQVRNYEASGLLPPAMRSSSGYRLYTEQHLTAHKTVRKLVSCYGWQRTPMIMQALHRGDLAAALAVIDTGHTELASKRLQIEQTLVALGTLATQSPPLPNPRLPQRLLIGEAAKHVGVSVATLHFWEQQGLLHPQRDQSNRYRCYDEHQLHRLRVVALLREAGYDAGVILLVLDELTAGRPATAIAAVEKKRADLTRTSWACVEAMAMFQQYVSEFCAQVL